MTTGFRWRSSSSSASLSDRQTFGVDPPDLVTFDKTRMITSDAYGMLAQLDDEDKHR